MPKKLKPIESLTSQWTNHVPTDKLDKLKAVACEVVNKWGSDPYGLTTCGEDEKINALRTALLDGFAVEEVAGRWQVIDGPHKGWSLVCDQVTGTCATDDEGEVATWSHAVKRYAAERADSLNALEAKHYAALNELNRQTQAQKD